MNRIYRVIWSHVRHCYVVVSELAKGHRRPGTIQTGSISIAALAVVTLLCSTSFAAKGEGEASKQWGINTVASGEYATAWGWGTQATGQGATAFGYKTTASGIRATAFGEEAVASGTNAIAWGEKSKASGYTSTAFGYKTTASDSYATAFGNETTASNYAATAFGYETTASNMYATAFGKETKASGYTSTALGYNTTASGSYATAFGNGTTANGDMSTSFGEGTSASGNLATAFGQNTTASGFGATAFGESTVASGTNAAALGYKTIASGKYATAFGNESKAYGKNSFAALGGIVGSEGNGDSSGNSAAIGNGATVLVSDTLALGSGSVADRDVKTYAKEGAFSPVTRDIDIPTWKGTANAIAIGDAKNGVTRQLTGLAAGSEDTDAVNVAQLKAVSADSAGKTGDLQYAGTHYVAKNDNLTVAVGKLDNQVNVNATAISTNTTDITTLNNHVGIGTVLQAGNAANLTTAVNMNYSGIQVLNQYAGIEKQLNAGNAIDLTEGVNNAYAKALEASGEAVKHTTVSAKDDNIVINTTTNKDGSKDYGISFKSGVTFDDVTADTGTIGGLTIADNSLTKGTTKVVLGGDASQGTGITNGQASLILQDKTVTLIGATGVDGDVSVHGNVTAKTASLGDVKFDGGIASGADFTTTYKGNTVSLNDVYNRTSHIKRTDDYTTIIGDTVAVRAVGGTHKGGLFLKGIVDGDPVIMTQFLEDGSAVIGKVGIKADGKITGVAAGTANTDAVNVAQLKAVSADSAVKTGDLQYTSAKYVAKDDNLTVAVGKLDNQVNVNATAISTNTTDITTLNNHVGIGTVLQAGNAANLTTAVNMNYSGIQVLNQYAGIEKQLNAGNAIDLTEGVNNAYAKALEASEEAVKHTTVSAKDDNIIINTTTNEDGSKNYDVSLNPVVNLDEVTAGKGTLGGVTMADGIASGTDFTTTYKGNTVSLNDVYNRTSQIKQTDDYTTLIGDTVAVRAVGGAHKGGIFLKGIVDGNAGTVTQFLEDGSAVIGKVGIKADGKISGVAAGTEGTDAVNYNQLKAVQTEAGKHSVVKAGDKNLIVTDTETDGQHEYAVSLGKDITLEGTLTAANASLKGLTVDGGTVLRNGGTSFTVNNTGVFAQAGSTSVTMTSSGVNVIAPTTQVTGNANVVGKLSENGVQVATKDDIKAVDKDLSGLSGKLDNVSNKVDSLDKTVINQGEAIKDLQKDTAQNKQDITQNKNDIAQNKENIAANKTQIDKNTSDIAANKGQIDKNTAAIEQNKQDIAANKAQIDKNTAAIDKNTSDIAKNTEQINKNAEKIQSNTERIDGLEKSNSATNEQVKKNTEAINQNKADIQANKDAIALEVKNRENAVKDEALKRETEDKALSGRIDANKTVIDKHTELIGATGENGTLKLQNGETTVEAGINKNTADIKVNADNIAKNAAAIEDNSKAIGALGSAVNKLDTRVNRIGAGAAALAALHPLDYDPENKWDFAAGYGNYGGASAVAIGTYYRPNENTMLSLGGSFGSGENMVNAGVSFKIGAGSSAVLPSRTVMAKEMARQADEIKELKELVQQLLEQK